MRALLVAVPLLLVACGGAQPSAEHATSAGPLVPAGQAKVGDKTKCPVTGEEFVVKADSPKVEHEGKTYYFCCAHCIEQFRADPKKYLSGS